MLQGNAEAPPGYQPFAPEYEAGPSYPQSSPNHMNGGNDTQPISPVHITTSGQGQTINIFNYGNGNVFVGRGSNTDKSARLTSSAPPDDPPVDN
jgi:hypothetical protein